MGDTYDDRVSHSENPTRFIKQRVSDISPILDADDDGGPKIDSKTKPTLLISAAAGGFAGVVVDITLYPLDTIKTRLQSQFGFRASGGFKGMYKGVLPVLLGSAPISAIFFITYNSIINLLRTDNYSLNPLVYLVAASTAEIIGASLRVPLEVIKQRKQISNSTSICIMKKTFRKEGVLGFYRGFWSTLMREIPFSAIQFPLWELILHNIIIYQNGEELSAFQTACCGSIAGAFAAAVTTPMDVIKTRIMLAEKEKIDSLGTYPTWRYGKEIYLSQGLRGLFAGCVPRMLWIMLGGFIYFGSYEKMKLFCQGQKNPFFEKKEALDTAPSYVDSFPHIAPSEEIIRDSNDNQPRQKKEDDEKIDDQSRPKEEGDEKMTAKRQDIIDTTLLKSAPGLTED